MLPATTASNISKTQLAVWVTSFKLWMVVVELSYAASYNCFISTILVCVNGDYNLNVGLSVTKHANLSLKKQPDKKWKNISLKTWSA